MPLIKMQDIKESTNMNEPMFLPDIQTNKLRLVAEGSEIRDFAAVVAGMTPEQVELSKEFAQDIADHFVTDFKKEGDQMVHVSTFCFINDVIYTTYYANTSNGAEDPKFQRARLTFCPVNDPQNITYIDVQSAGDVCGGKTVDAVYDTIVMRKDDEVLYLLWTARLDGNYYRLYRTYTIATGELGPVGVNRLKINDDVCDFSFSGIQSILAANGLPRKNMFSDIGIMQKQSWVEENGEMWCYSGAYSGDLTFIIKSKDLITWEYVSQPDFINWSKWENATYVLGNRVFYFVRQQDQSPFSFLTCYNKDTDTWDKPVMVTDSQSRGDFIMYKGNLFLFHAPYDREHIGIVKVDTDDISKSSVVLQAKMHESCFYPFVEYGNDGLYMSYTVGRRHIKLAHFDADKYLK